MPLVTRTTRGRRVAPGPLRVRRADALLRLTEAGYDIPTVINKDIVAQLVDWIAALDCYELVFQDVRDAVEKLRSGTP